MTDIAWTIGLIAGFVWHTLALPTGAALAAYVLVWVFAPSKWKYLARHSALAIWFALVAYQLLKIAAVRAYSLGAPFGTSLIIGGAVVLVMAGLGFVVIHSNRRALRWSAVASTFLLIGLVASLPYGDRFRNRPVAKPVSAKEDVSNQLATAAQAGNLSLIHELVERRGADVDTGILGISPLHIAVMWRQLEAADLLIRLGANVNRQAGSARRSPLHSAIVNGDVAMIRLLLKRGASLTVTTPEGQTPLDFATDPLTRPANGDRIAAILRKAASENDSQSIPGLTVVTE